MSGFATLDALRESLARPAAKIRSPEYVAKMMHTIPEVKSIDREKFILDRCKGKTVLDIGASGRMHALIAKTAAKCYGIDREDGDGVVGVNLDDVSVTLPVFDGVELVVCGEVLEHLANPGWFLQRLKKAYQVPVVITVPNAFSAAGYSHMERGIENINCDHVSWYSWKTMSVLLGRYGYEIDEWHWYGGEPITAEGLIFLVH